MNGGFHVYPKSTGATRTAQGLVAAHECALGASAASVRPDVGRKLVNVCPELALGRANAPKRAPDGPCLGLSRHPGQSLVPHALVNRNMGLPFLFAVPWVPFLPVVGRSLHAR